MSFQTEISFLQNVSPYHYELSKFLRYEAPPTPRTQGRNVSGGRQAICRSKPVLWLENKIRGSQDDDDGNDDKLVSLI